MRDIEIYKLDDAKVHKLALETKNERMTQEEQVSRLMLPSLKYKQDFRRRVFTGGALTFLEAKYMVRELLTFDKWKIRFYEVIQFPQVRFFESEYQALKYWKKIKSAQTLKAEKATLEKPAEHIYGERLVEEEFEKEGYQPDPMGVRF
jgi:hypothetical protein